MDTFFNQEIDTTATRSEEHSKYKVTYYYNKSSDFVGYIEEWAAGEVPEPVGGTNILYKGDQFRGPIIGYTVTN